MDIKSVEQVVFIGIPRKKEAYCYLENAHKTIIVYRYSLGGGVSVYV